MTVLVIGAEGQLGTDLCRVFADAGLHRADLDGNGHHVDIRDGDAVHQLIFDDVRPNLVINTAAAHNVAECEANVDLAFAVNGMGAYHVAAACQEGGARLVHISTDYVFGHGATRPYVETDLPEPLNVYAASKRAGELLIAAACPDHLIVRTAALYGTAPCRAKGGRNFVELMRHLAATQPEVKVVTDEITTPTYTLVLARQIRLLAEKAEPGLYHATCGGACSWYEFAEAIFAATNTGVTLVKATTADFPSHVQRPEYSVLENKHAQDQGLDIMPPWRDALDLYLAETEKAARERP